MKTFGRLTESGVVAVAVSACLLVACGGGGGSGSASSNSGFTQTYTSSAGVGEVMQFRIDTTNLTYSYTVAETSYAASGVSSGQTGTGTLTSNGDGTYAVGPSSDNFIQSGRVRPIRAMFVGHVQIGVIGGSEKIPVFGLSNPITSVAGLADGYNFQGFSCSSRGIANVLGKSACASHYGTGSIDTAGTYSICVGGDLNDTGAHPCTSTLTGRLQAVAAYPGVFDYWNASNGHIGWLFAFTAANGQKVMVIDHDDALSLRHEFGHSVFTTYASVTPGSLDGDYFVKNNEGGEHLVSIAGTSASLTLFPGLSTTLAYNSPWNGMISYQVPAAVGGTATGIMMATGSGAYTHVSGQDPALFGLGFKYR